jgi:2-phosphoglycolate phosphatase
VRIPVRRKGQAAARRPVPWPKIIAGVIYDHDGTLIDSLGAVVAATNRVLREQGFASATTADIVAGMARATAPRMGWHSGVADPAAQQRLALAFYAAARALSPRRSRPYPGIAGMVRALARRGIRQGVVSNNEGALVRAVLAAHGLAAHLADVRGDADVPAPKPDPRGLLQCVEALGLTPGQCLYVGDSPCDAATARAAGMASVGVTWGIHRRSEMGGMGFTRLVDRPAELLALVGGGATGGITPPARPQGSRSRPGRA